MNHSLQQNFIPYVRISIKLQKFILAVLCLISVISKQFYTWTSSFRMSSSKWGSLVLYLQTRIPLIQIAIEVAL